MNLAANVEIQNRGTGNRNVNCGSLRRIGKTTVLRTMMIEYKNENPNHSVILLLPYLSMAEQYRDLQQNGILDNILSIRNFERNIRDGNTYIFSDEVPNAQQLAEQYQQPYIAGFYTDITRNRRSDSADALAYTFSSMPADETAVVTRIIDPKQRYKYITGRL